MSVEEGYLLDTSVASAVFDKGHREHDKIRKRLEQLGEAILYICPVLVGEVECGLKIAPFVDHERQVRVRDAMAQYECLEIDYHTSEAYSNIRAKLLIKYSPKKRRNKLARYVEDLINPITGKELGIQENDLWIVSVAVEYNLVFITRDQGGGMERIVQEAGYLPRTLFW